MTGIPSHSENAAVALPENQVPEDLYASWSPTIGPDAAIAFVSDRLGEPLVHIQWAGKGELTLLRVVPPRVLKVRWSPDGSWLALETGAPARSRHEVWVVRPDGSDLRRLAGSDELGTAEIADGPLHGWTATGQLMVTESNTTGRALLLDPATGARLLLAEAPLLTLLDTAQDEGLALLRYGPRCRRHLVLLDLATGEQREIGPPAGAGSTDQACFRPGHRVVYARSDALQEHATLLSIPLDHPEGMTVVAARRATELDAFALTPDGRTAALLWNVDGGHSDITLIDLETNDTSRIDVLPRDVVTDCRPLPGGQMVITAESWSDPKGIWMLDIQEASATPVSSSGGTTLYASRGAHPATISVASLTPPQLHRFEASDGTALNGWFYRPESPGPWPAMLHLHGGPEAQERPVYNSLFQTLVAAGYAVLAPNVRGSTGFGRAFRSADDRELRSAAISDVEAAARHLVMQGLSKPDQLGCMGRSYGGYLTLAALTTYPDLFRVGIDVCGIVEFGSFYRDTEPWIAATATSKYGDPKADAALLDELSPFRRLSDLSAPLLIVHGTDDTNVPWQQAEMLTRSLRSQGKQHHYLTFEGEGHELLLSNNRVRFVDQTIAWLNEHLPAASMS